MGNFHLLYCTESVDKTILVQLTLFLKSLTLFLEKLTIFLKRLTFSSFFFFDSRIIAIFAQQIWKRQQTISKTPKSEHTSMM